MSIKARHRNDRVVFRLPREGYLRILLLILTIVLMGFLVCTNVFGQEHLSFDHLGMGEGLSESIVLCVVQDVEGYMWFGTADGLNRYDGYQFTVFRHTANDSTSISNNYVQVLFVDREGILWIGSLGGLDWFDAEQGTFHHVALVDGSSKKENGIQSILEDESGSVWIGTAGGGVVQLQPMRSESKGIKSVSIEHRFDGDVNVNRTWMFVNGMALDANGNLWIATLDSGIYILHRSTGEMTRPNYGVTFSSKRTKTICISKRKNVWIGFEDNGIDKLDLATATLNHYEYNAQEQGKLAGTSIRSIYEDSHGRIWVGMDGGGLLRYDNATDTSKPFRHDPTEASSPSSDRIMCVYEDRSGTIWFGTWGSGVDRWSPIKDKFSNSDPMKYFNERVSNKFIISLFQDSKGVLWAGTHGGGVFFFDQFSNTVSKFDQATAGAKGIACGVIWSIKEDEQGNMWFATDMGVDKYNPVEKKFTHFDERLSEHGALSSRYAGRVEPFNGNVWVTTDKSLDKINIASGAITNFPFKLALHDTAQGYVGGLYIDHEGIILLGTTPMIAFDTKRECYANPDVTIGNGLVSCISMDRAGSLWVGTFGDGVYCFDQKKKLIWHFTEMDGLPNNVVYGVLEDLHGNYWMSTNHGLSKYAPLTHSFRTYDITEGLQDNEFNRGAFFQSQNGTMYFGGINGFTAFIPDSIKDDSYLPPVVLTSFRKFDEKVVFQRPLSRIKEIVLRSTENFFTFEFAALDFVQPSKNLYAYQLEGFDREWVQAGNLRQANYTNVGPGEYVFHVKGSNSDGVWNESGVSIRVIIPPPFWKTTWFIVLAVLSGVSIFGATIRYFSTQKLKKKIVQLEKEKAIQEERQRTREQIARDLHDDLASTVGSAGLYVESVKRQIPDAPKQAKDFLDKTGLLLLEAEQSMSDIVWSVSPRHDTMESLLLRIRQLTSDVCKANGIRYELKLPDQEGNRRIPDDVRRNLYLIFKEALNNAVRYSSCQLVAVSFELRGDEIRMELSDDGKGFSYNGIDAVRVGKTTRGNGLRNMRARAEEIGAEFSIVSGEGKGTSITIKKRMTQTGH